MLKPKTKIALIGSALATLDVAAAGLLFYIALKSMSLLAWVFLMMLIFVFILDFAHAVKFLSNLLK